MKVTILLADAAQAVEGKLYILGGGWSITGPDPSPMSRAAPESPLARSQGWRSGFRDRVSASERLPAVAAWVAVTPAGGRWFPALDEAPAF